MTRRKIHLPSGIWEYYISRSHQIVIWSPSGEKHLADMHKLTGLTWDEIEKGAWKGWLRICPSDIRDYIKSELLGIVQKG